MATITSRFNSSSLVNMVAQLEAWVESSQDALDNAENADYPNDERCYSLEQRIDRLNEAIDILYEIKS